MISWLEERLEKLNPVQTKAKNGGYTRLGYTSEEALAVGEFIHIAKELDMNIRKDSAGNVIATWEGKDPSLPVIAMGSHLDTVKNGGAYDGAAGVLAGLAVVKFLKDEEYQPIHSIEVIVFASEESSRFGVATIGSKAMTGLLDIERIGKLKDIDGLTVADAFASQGLDLPLARQAIRDKREIHSFIELHIEQGPILESSGKEIGLVIGIASPLRLSILIHGMAGHTGTTPMGKRKDALTAAAEITLFVEQIGGLQAHKHHLVATTSVIHAEPNVMNVIPETVRLGIDIRSINDHLKDETGELIKRFSRSLEEKRGIEIEIQELGNEPAVQLNPSVMSRLMEAVNQLEFCMMRLVSGAGHDAMNMAHRWPAGMIFIPCRGGISHHPDEYAELSDLYKGVKVMAQYIKLVEKGDRNEP